MSLRTMAAAVAVLGSLAVPTVAAHAEDIVGGEAPGTGKGIAVVIGDPGCQSLGDGWVRIVGPINTARGPVRVCQKGLN